LSVCRYDREGKGCKVVDSIACGLDASHTHTADQSRLAKASGVQTQSDDVGQRKQGKCVRIVMIVTVKSLRSCQACLGGNSVLPQIF
jgi:hypothetical protein